MFIYFCKSVFVGGHPVGERPNRWERQCWKQMKAHSAFCAESLKRCNTEDSLLILVYKHSCWVHSVSNTLVLLQRLPGRKLPALQAVLLQVPFHPDYSRWTVCCSSGALRICGGLLKCCSGTHQEGNILLLHLSSKVFNKGQFRYILFSLGKKKQGHVHYQAVLKQTWISFRVWLVLI